MRRVRWTILFLLGAILGAAAQQSVDLAQKTASEFDSNLTKSVALAIRSIATVTPGMTRSDLLQVFTT